MMSQVDVLYIRKTRWQAVKTHFGPIRPGTYNIHIQSLKDQQYFG